MPRILAQFPLRGGFVKPLVQPRALEQDPAPHTGVTERWRTGNPAFRGIEEVSRRNVKVGRRLSQCHYGRIRLGARDFIGCIVRLSRHARRRRCGRGSLCLDLGRHTSIGIHQNPFYVSGLRPDVCRHRTLPLGLSRQSRGRHRAMGMLGPTQGNLRVKPEKYDLHKLCK